MNDWNAQRTVMIIHEAVEELAEKHGFSFRFEVSTQKFGRLLSVYVWPPHDDGIENSFGSSVEGVQPIIGHEGIGVGFVVYDDNNQEALNRLHDAVIALIPKDQNQPILPF